MSRRTYVDNAANRRAGRVGMPLGTAVISRSSAGSSSSYGCGGGGGGTYVDNAYNRSVGRVGLPYGTAVISSRGSDDSYCSERTYVDNAFNRSVGRVGMPLGTAVISRSDTSSLNRAVSKLYVDEACKVYKDNDFNREIGRVGKPLGSVPVFQLSNVQNNIGNIHPDHPEYGAILNEIKLMKNREEEVKSYKERSRTTSAPKTELKNIKDLEIIPYEKIQFGKQIGEGGFGVVYFAHLEGTVIAVKKLRVQRVSRKRLDNFTAEVKLLNKLDHPNIVKFIGACITTPNLAICLEYMDMTFYDAIHMREIAFSSEERREMMLQVAKGLEYLHKKNVAHCDIKSKNMMMNYSPQSNVMVAKITDFGLSQMKIDAETSSSANSVTRKNFGTPKYSAPEILRGESVNLKGMKMADVYSIGLVFFEVVCEEEPFGDLNIHQMHKQVGENGKKVEIPSDHKLDHDFESCLCECWNMKPEFRPSASDLVVVLEKCRNVYK